KDMCSTESMIHWWFKNKFICVGDNFSVKTDTNREYVCKDVIVENVIIVDGYEYRPDTTVITDSGTIYFEFAYSNKKKIDDYMHIWNKLDCMVVEIDVKNLVSESKIFNAIYYKGKVFKKNKKYQRMQAYIERVGIDKSEKLEEVSRIKRLNWFWTDAIMFKEGKISITDLICSIEALDDCDKGIVRDFFSVKSCLDVRDKFVKDVAAYIVSANSDIVSKLRKLDGFKISPFIKNSRRNGGDMYVAFNYVDRYGDRSVSHLDCTSNELEKRANSLLKQIHNEYRFNENVYLAKNNTILSEAIKKVKSDIYDINSSYDIYSRFGFYGMYISMYFNRNECVNIDISDRDDIFCGDDINYIYNFIKNKTDEYLGGRQTNSNISNIITSINK
ncbi:MAG: hypothetical protein ACRDD7_11175, partial [Peptostreptococcaceae bacterium]